MTLIDINDEMTWDRSTWTLLTCPWCDLDIDYLSKLNGHMDGNRTEHKTENRLPLFEDN